MALGVTVRALEAFSCLARTNQSKIDTFGSFYFEFSLNLPKLKQTK